MSKTQQKYLKNTIKHEENHRKYLQREHDLWSPRLMMKEVGVRILTNAAGVKGATINLDDFSVEKIQQVIHDLEEGIKTSEWKEKFMRFSHNNDKIKATKYHNKINEWYVDTDGKLRDIAEEGGNSAFQIDNRVNGTAAMMTRGEEGFMEFSKEMKKAYEWRSKILECI
tara:strand:- start:109 stop:615 length:507 start_codon:yes stop_codon:yes gene_type:complete